MKTIRLLTFLSCLLFSATINTQAQTVTHYPLSAQLFYAPKLPQTDMNHAKTELTRILRGIMVWVAKDNIGRIPKKVFVFDDRIEMTFKEFNSTYYFSDILHYPILVSACSLQKTNGRSGPIYYCALELGKFKISEQNKGDAMELADYLFFFQRNLHIQTPQQRYDSLMVLFEPIAAQYRLLKVKPPITEGQRKYIVQANSFSEQKMYEKAIELYIKAIEVDQTAYPAAYSNLALLSAQLVRYEAAIYYMKKYLLLEPEASDARGAQDKIYVWEAKLGK